MSQSPLRKYLGNGTITSSAGTRIDCEFVLSQFPNKDPILVCTSHDWSALSLIKENLQAHPLECSFEGFLVDSTACVKVDSIYLNSSHISTEVGLTFEFYLIGAIGLECLKSHLPDYFKKKDKMVDLSSFRSSLEALFHDISMPYDPTELYFIKVRDKIVHTGRFPPSIRYIEEYDKLVNLYDRTILTILGYRGKPYHNQTKNYAKELVP